MFGKATGHIPLERHQSYTCSLFSCISFRFRCVCNFGFHPFPVCIFSLALLSICSVSRSLPALFSRYTSQTHAVDLIFVLWPKETKVSLGHNHLNTYCYTTLYNTFTTSACLKISSYLTFILRTLSWILRPQVLIFFTSSNTSLFNFIIGFFLVFASQAPGHFAPSHIYLQVPTLKVSEIRTL